MSIFRRSQAEATTSVIDLNAPRVDAPAPEDVIDLTDKPDPALGLAVKKLRDGGRFRRADDAVYPSDANEPSQR
jgi:hypothetical protein